VGKIPPDADDDLVRDLLELCGALRSWKRVLDPESGARKRFGFADFEHPEGVRRALAALGEDLGLATRERLLVNVNQATRACVDAHEARRRADIGDDPEAEARDAAEMRRLVAALRSRVADFARVHNDGEGTSRAASLASPADPGLDAKQSAAAFLSTLEQPEQPSPPAPLARRRRRRRRRRNGTPRRRRRREHVVAFAVPPPLGIRTRGASPRRRGAARARHAIAASRARARRRGAPRTLRLLP
jgi:hypothetical protein